MAKSAMRIFYCSDYEKINQAVSEYGQLEKISWSMSGSECDLEIKSANKRNLLTEIEAIYRGEHLKITIPFNDDGSIENAIHCWLYLLEKGYDNPVIAQRMEKLIPVTMRLELKAGINGNTIINDSYNSDIASLGIALDLLNQQHQHSKKVLILSDIHESGKELHDLYTEVADLISSKKVDQIIGVGEKMIQNQDCFDSGNTHFFNSTGEVIDALGRLQFENCAILIKGSRAFQFEKISRSLEYKNHETVLEINLSAIQNNLNYYRSLLKPETKVMAMVKAFSYGSGTHEIANVMQFNNVDYLGVAYADEGIALRTAGVTIPIMVMNPEREAFHAMINYKLEPEIYNQDLLADFIEVLRSSLMSDGTVFPIHIKLDTGMHRLGFQEDELDALLTTLGDNSIVNQTAV
ncbi:MAG: alanine racemase [Flavobacteriales bacterium]|nr:alanine racemase [Flavobacteriales bacterium]